MIRRLVALILCAVLAAVAVPRPATGHTQSAAQAVCNWNEVVRYGPNPNGILYLDCTPLHAWGGHQAYATVETTGGTCLFVRIINMFDAEDDTDIPCDSFMGGELG